MVQQHAENKGLEAPESRALGTPCADGPLRASYGSVRDVAKADKCGKAIRDYYGHS
jgi:hypothetical protein